MQVLWIFMLLSTFYLLLCMTMSKGFKIAILGVANMLVVGISQGLLLSLLKHYTGSKLDLISNRSQMNVIFEKHHRPKKELLQIKISNAIHAETLERAKNHT